MKAKILLVGAFAALSLTAFSQYTRNDNQNSNPYARAYQRIDAGNSYTIELRNGELWSCGTNASGQLGIGNTTNQLTPTQVGTGTNWQVFSTGFTHSLAIKSDGTLWGWGSNYYGSIGDGTTTDRNAPVQIGTDNKWVMVSAGNNFTVALKSNGTIWAWGVNSSGQLGTGNTTSQNAPVQVGSSTDWKYINCGQNQTFGIKANGTLWSWGDDLYGALGNGAISGDITSPAQIGTSTTWLKISCRYYHVLGLKTTGELYGWGHNGHGQLGLGNTTNQPSPALIGSSGYQNISVGEGFSYAIKAGQLFACGNNVHGQLSQGNTTNLSTFTAVGTNTNVVAMVGSNGFGAVLYANSDLNLTGRNNAGQFGTGNTTNSLSLINRSSNTAGWLNAELHHNSSYALKQDGTIWSWGNAYTNTPVQLGTDNDWISIVGQGLPGTSERFFALKADGTLWRYDGTNFNLTSSTTTYRSIYSSQRSPVYAITTDGNLYTFTTSNTGTLLSSSGDWVRANGGGLSGNTFTVGLKNDGTVWVNGANNYQGIYGNGTTTTVAGFNQTTISNVIGIASCNFTAFAIKSSGDVMAWGGNQFGELHNGSSATYSSTPVLPTNATNVIKFDTEEEGYNFAIKSNGTLWHCGSYGGDGSGPTSTLTQHPTANNVVEVVKGRRHGSIIKSQRNTLCLTGENSYGQLGDGTTTNNYYFDCGSVVAIKPPKQTHNTNNTQKDLNASENNTFDVYPVPSTGVISIKATDNSDILSVEVMDLQGTVVFRLSNDRIDEVDLSNLPKGSYFIRMFTETQAENRKIVLM